MMREFTDQDLILDLFGELDPATSAELEREMARSPELLEKRDRLRAVVERYRAEPEEEPPPVDLEVLVGQAAPARPSGPSRTMGPALMRFAAVLVIAVAAFLAGRVSHSPDDDAGPAVDRLRALAAETARLQDQVNRLALQQERATDRIAAIEAVALGDEIEPLLAREIWRVLRNDPNANVRLAALDALFSAPEVVPETADFEQLLASEPEVSVRLALVGWIAAAKPAGWEGVLRAAGRSDQSAAVRSRAQALLGGAI